MTLCAECEAQQPYLTTCQSPAMCRLRADGTRQENQMTLTTKELRPDYHARIMNVRPSGTVATPDTFVCGYRDARHDAAEIATQADAEISALRAEVERLRTALSAIEDAENYIRGDWFELADWYRRHARFTLSEGNK